MGEREITARSDVYALGAVLYECLTGDPPFTGSTAQAVVARVVTETPRPMLPQRHTIPAYVEAAVLRALEKLPADRFASAAQFAEALTDRSAIGLRHTAPMLRPTLASLRQRKRAAAVAGALLLLLLATMAGSYRLGRAVAAPVPAARFALTIPADQRLTSVDPLAALSPGGELLAYSAEGEAGIPQLFLRPLDQLTALPLPGTDNGCCPSFSPDGRDLAFLQQGVFKRISARGGAATTIPVTGSAQLNLLRWAGDDEFVVTTSEGKLAWLGNDSRLRTVAAPDSAAGEGSLDVMDVLPGGGILAIATIEPPGGTLAVFDPEDGSRIPLSTGTVNWAGFSDGHLVWSQPGGLLYAAPFDPRRARITGPVQSLGVTVQQTRGSRPKIAQLGHATLAYVPAQALSLVSVSRQGRLTTLLEQPRSYHSPRISPDGRYIALDFSETTRDVWLLDRGDSTMSRATFQRTGHDPTWLPNGREIVFAEARGPRVGVVRTAVDGSRPVDSVYFEGTQVSIHSVTPDGRTGIAVRYTSVAGGGDIVTVPLRGRRYGEAARRHTLRRGLSRALAGRPLAGLRVERGEPAGGLPAGARRPGRQAARLAERRQRAGLVSRRTRAVLPEPRSGRAAADRGEDRDRSIAACRLPHAALPGDGL